MVRIFAENFRGFRSLNLPIESVGFLVGDNSSGKSSIIHLANYVLNSHLLGLPRLQDEFHIDKYDFFSPYLDNAPVTIGCEWKEGEVSVCRMLTISCRPGEAPKIERYSISGGTFALTIVSRGSQTFAAFKSRNGGWTADSLRRHHFRSSGYKLISENLYGESINSHIAADTCARVVGADAAEDHVSAAIFGAPFGLGARQIGAVRAEPERFYPFSRTYKATGSHFASMWKDLDTGSSKRKDAKVLELVSRFGKESGMFDAVMVKPLSIEVANAPMIVTVHRNKKEFLIDQVGVGVSQIVPILVDVVFSIARPNNPQVFLVQQPELHLHPVAQAAAGDFVFETARQGISFLIETHSDFLIDRFRAKIRESTSKLSASIFYCESSALGNRMSRVQVNADGTLKDPPNAYHAFFLKEFSRTMF